MKRNACIQVRTFKATLNGNDVTNQFEIVSYGENVEAGKGTIVLKVKDGNKNFTGDNITAEFNIVKEQVKGSLKLYNDKGIDITNSNPDKTFTFDGNEKTFSKVLLSGLTKTDNSTTTAKASDFEIKYADNIAGNKNIAYVYAIAKDGSGFAGKDTITTADGTIIKNSTGYTAQLKPQGVSENIFYAGVFSDTSSAALRAISGGSNGSDYLVIGQDQTAEGFPYYRN